jgi:hypothetical protein
MSKILYSISNLSKRLNNTNENDSNIIRRIYDCTYLCCSFVIRSTKSNGINYYKHILAHAIRSSTGSINLVGCENRFRLCHVRGSDEKIWGVYMEQKMFFIELRRHVVKITHDNTAVVNLITGFKQQSFSDPSVEHFFFFSFSRLYTVQ